MGWWGEKPTDSDAYADAWAEVMVHVNVIAMKSFREAINTGDLYAAVGVVLSMGEAGIPIEHEVYGRAREALEEVEASDFLDDFKNPKRAKQVFAQVKRELTALARKVGPAIGLAGFRVKAVLSEKKR